MAYSMFECPKLHYVKSMKFFPEECDHHISFRHKNLPPNFDLTPKFKQHESIETKCPIYVHNLSRLDANLGDCPNKNRKKMMKNKRSVLEKLEETYWANWKPGKEQRIVEKSKSPDRHHCKKAPVEIQVIKSAPNRKVKSPKRRPITEDNIESQIESDNKKSEEIQTETNGQDDANANDKNDEKKFLKHTDSFILNSKKQKEQKEHFEQPRCIRLYRKPGKMTSSKNFVKGGSYPLKSCLKKESNFNKGNIRLGRPGSPVIVTSNYSSRSNRTHHHHHKR